VQRTCPLSGGKADIAIRSHEPLNGYSASSH
jgi:hypothetical protein